MNLDNVIEFARALGICELTSKPKQDIHYSLTIHEMLSFANLVAEYERIECADLCRQATLRFHDLWEKFEYPEDQAMSIAASQCAAMIQERGNHERTN
jgi:hypothetical protein